MQIEDALSRLYIVFIIDILSTAQYTMDEIRKERSNVYCASYSRQSRSSKLINVIGNILFIGYFL